MQRIIPEHGSTTREHGSTSGKLSFSFTHPVELENELKQS